MRKVIVFLGFISGITAPAAHAQPLADRLASQDFEVEGVRLYGVTAFTGWASSAYPLTSSAGSGILAPGTGALGPDESYGFTASVGWQLHRQRTALSVLYSGTYQGLAHYSNLNAYSQSLSLSASRSLTPRWGLSVSGSAQDATLAQTLFQPSTGLTQAPSSFDDLAALVSIGQFTNSQIASILTGSPLLESPTSNTLMGNRILSYAAQASMVYSASSRLQFHFGSVSAGGQSREGGGNNLMEQSIREPRTVGLNAGAGFSYSLSPRTSFGVTAEGDRIDNLNQKAYTSTVSASIGRKMGMHWFLQAHAGESLNTVVEQAYGTPKTRQIVGGGSIGFRTYRHSLTGTYNRNSSDTYGFAVGTVATYSGNWMYHAPGGRWTLFATYSQEQMRNTGFMSLSGWQAGGGLSESLNNRTILTTQYVYQSSSETYQGSLSNYAVHSVRLSVGWRPQPTATSPHTP
jgi:hypothetical protein